MLTWEALNKEIPPRFIVHHLTECRIKCTRTHGFYCCFPLQFLLFFMSKATKKNNHHSCLGRFWYPTWVANWAFLLCVVWNTTGFCYCARDEDKGTCVIKFQFWLRFFTRSLHFPQWNVPPTYRHHSNTSFHLAPKEEQDHLQRHPPPALPPSHHTTASGKTHRGRCSSLGLCLPMKRELHLHLPEPLLSWIRIMILGGTERCWA